MTTLEASLKLKDQFSATLKKIDNSLKNTAQSMQDFKSKATGPAQALQKLGTIAQSAVSKLNSGLRTGLTAASTVVKSSVERILSIFGNFGNRISSKLKLDGVINKFTSGFNNLKSKVSSVVSSIGNSFNKLTGRSKKIAAIEDINKQLDKLKNKEAKIKVNVDNLQKAQNNINKIDQRLKTLSDKKAELKANASNLENAQKKIDSVQRNMDKLNDKKAVLSLKANKLDNAKKKLSEVQQEIKKLNNEKIKLDTNMFSSAIAKMKSGISEMVSKVSSAGAKIKTMFASMKGSFQQFGTDMGGALDKMGVTSAVSKIGTAVKVGAVAGVAAVTGLGKKIYDVGGEFSTQMSRVKSIAGATGTEFTSLKNQAMDLGASTAFSATESAAGMENLASAGFNANEIMSAMPGLLDLAAVSGGDIALASENAASALRGFGLDANQAGHVANVFARAAADTNAEVGDMGEALKYIAPVANAMGISIEETAAAVGILSDAGIKGSQAGTSMRGALSRLAKPTKAMTDTMSELGLSFYDSQGNMKPLVDQVSMLQNAFKGLTPEQQQNALVTLYGQESLSGMLALVQRGPKELAKLTKSLKDSGGAADAMAREMQNNLPAKMEQVGGAIETAFLRTYQRLEPALMKLADSAAEWIDRAFSDKNINGFFDNLAKYGNVLKDAFNDIKGPVGDALSAVGKSIEKITGKFGSEKNVSGFKSFVEGITDAIKNLANFAEKHSDTIAKLITNLPKIGLAIAGFKMAKGAFNFGSGLFDAVTATGTLLSNLTGIGKKMPKKAPTPKPQTPGSVPGANPMGAMPMLMDFAKKAGNLALVFGTIKLVEAAAEALKQVNDKVPADLSMLAPKLLNMGIAIASMDAFVKRVGKFAEANPRAAIGGLAAMAGISANLMLAAEAMKQINAKVPDDIASFAPKMANMGIALASMGALVTIASKLASKNPMSAGTGLVAIAGVSANLMIAAEAIQQVNAKVPNDIGNFAPKMANMGIAIVGLGALVAVAGALASKNLTGAIAGLGVIAGISGNLMLAAEALKQVNDKVPSNIGDFAPKVANMALAITGMGALTAAAGALMATGVGAVIAAGGFLAIVGICAELMLVAEAIEQVNDKVPDDLTAVTTKIDNIEQVIIHFTEADLGNIFDVFSNMVGALNIGDVVSGINKFVELGDALSGFNDVTVPEGIDTKIQEMQQVIEKISTGDFWGKLGAWISSSLDSGIASNVSQAVKQYIKIGENLNELQNVTFNVGGVQAAINNIKRCTDLITEGGIFSKLGQNIGSDLDSGTSSNIKKTISQYIAIGESFNELQNVTFNINGVEAAINNINRVIEHISGGSLFGKIGDFFGGKMDNGTLNSVKKSVTNIISIGESFNELQNVAFHVDGAIAAVNNINKVITALQKSTVDGWTGANEAGDNLAKVKTAIQKINDLQGPLNSLANGEIQTDGAVTQLKAIDKVIQALTDVFSKGTSGTINGDALTQVKSSLDKIETLKSAINTVASGEVQSGNAILKINAIKTVIDALADVVAGNMLMAVNSSSGLDQVKTAMTKLTSIRDDINNFASESINIEGVKDAIEKVKEVMTALSGLSGGDGGASIGAIAGGLQSLVATFAMLAVSLQMVAGVAQNATSALQMMAVALQMNMASMLLINASFMMFATSAATIGTSVMMAIAPLMMLATTAMMVSAILITSTAGMTLFNSQAILLGATAMMSSAGLLMLGVAATVVMSQLAALNAALMIAMITMQLLVVTFQMGASAISAAMAQGMAQVVAVVVGGMALLAGAFAIGMAQAVAVVQSGSAAIVGAFASLNGQLYSAGLQAMSGLTNGINAGASSAIAAAESVANRVASTVRKALDIHSPSRVAFALGAFFTVGLANGMADATSLVDKASNDLAIAAVPNQLANISTSGDITSSVHLDDAEIERLQASASQTVVVKNKHVTPQVSVHVENNNGEPVDADDIADKVAGKIIEAMDSDLG